MITTRNGNMFHKMRQSDSFKRFSEWQTKNQGTIIPIGLLLALTFMSMFAITQPEKGSDIFVICTFMFIISGTTLIANNKHLNSIGVVILPLYALVVYHSIIRNDWVPAHFLNPILVIIVVIIYGFNFHQITLIIAPFFWFFYCAAFQSIFGYDFYHDLMSIPVLFLMEITAFACIIIMRLEKKRKLRADE